MFGMLAPQTRRRSARKITVVGLICAAGLSATLRRELGLGRRRDRGAGRAVGSGGIRTGGTTATGGTTGDGRRDGTGGTRATGVATVGTGGAQRDRRHDRGRRGRGDRRDHRQGRDDGDRRHHATGIGGGSGQVGTIGGCQDLPGGQPLEPGHLGARSNPKGSTYLADMNPTKALHADWADYAAQGDYYGIPFTSGTGATPCRSTSPTGRTRAIRLHAPTGTACSATPSRSPRPSKTGRRRPSRPLSRHGWRAQQLHAVRAVPGPKLEERMDGGQRRDLPPGLECAPARRVDVGRRRRFANPGWTRPFRRDHRQEGDHARHPLHDELEPTCLHSSGDTCGGQRQHVLAADGPAHAPEGHRSTPASSPARRW